MAANRSRHLADEDLAWLCFSAVIETGGEEQDRVLRRHVTECEECAVRYGQLAETLAGLRESGVAEADLAFTPGRLEHQRAHILRRLEGAAQPARVVLFPSPSAKPSLHRVTRPTTRWIAAAAIAGLVVGMTVGRLVEIGNPTGGTPVQVGRSAQVAGALGRAGAAPGSGFESSADAMDLAPTSDEAFLSELDNAIYQPRIAELQALDAMTPVVGDVSFRLR